MAKVAIGKLEVEIPEATLWDAERIDEIEKRAQAPGERAADRVIESILLLGGAANPGLDAEKIKRALPFRLVKRAELLSELLREVYVAAGILDARAAEGEAGRP